MGDPCIAELADAKVDDMVAENGPTKGISLGLRDGMDEEAKRLGWTHLFIHNKR